MIDEIKSRSSEYQYLNILNRILEEGILCKNRTGIDTLAIPHVLFQHDMSTGFPLFTTKKMGFQSIKVELEFFIKGLKDKQWLQDRKCKIWDEWCNPSLIPQGLSDEERKKFQKEEKDLGPVYGSQWRNFNGQGYDQLKNIVDTLKKNPDDRRMVCSAFNPLVLSQQALPPCHFVWVVSKIGNKLHLSFQMRSVDMFLGFPFNIASYSTLLHLLCKESGFEEGVVSAYLDNCHLYINHKDQTLEQLKRTPFVLPKIETDKFTSIFDWEYKDTKVIDYKYHEAIKADVAV